MSIKLKALGLGLLALLATSAFSVMNASATISGHFTHDAADGHATIIGTETKPNHQLLLSIDGGNTIECTQASYHGTVTSNTVQELTITPSYGECITTGGETPHNVTVTMNGCDYVFYSPGSGHGTVTVNCPTGKAIEIHHPNCTVTVGTQHALTGGLVYHTDGKGLTATVTVGNIAAQYHGGICIFLGTNHTGTMNGNVTIKGQDTLGNEVTVRAT